MHLYYTLGRVFPAGIFRPPLKPAPHIALPIPAPAYPHPEKLRLKLYMYIKNIYNDI